MNSQSEPKWLEWAKRLQSIAQIGLTYCQDPYDRERFEQVRTVAAEIASEGTGTPVERIGELFAGETGYATPKVDVRGVVFHEGKLLLVRERGEGVWTLPGGWADVLESPREGVEREVFEESGYRVKATQLLAVYDRSKHPHEPIMPFHLYKIFIRCELLGGDAAESYETDGAGFFGEDELPEPLCLSRVTPGQIAKFFGHYRGEWTEADFD